MINQSGEIIYASNGCSDDQISEQDSEFNNNNNNTNDANTNNAANIDGYIINNNEDNNLEMNLRRRKGKIISCAKETFENASRHIRRRVPYAGHLMTPRRLWLNKIPTQCDVVIEFPGDAPDDALRWLLSRIRSQPPIGLGLQANVKAHESTKRTAFYISAPFNILHKAAEEARLPKRLRSDLGGALREFTTRESHCFQQLKSTDDGISTLFTSQERQWLVLQVLQGLRAGTSDLMALQGKAAVFEGQSIVAAWQETGIITQIFPLHETSALTKLQLNWVRKLFAAQPLDDIAEYFGVKVALYFAWLGHYTCALGVPAIFGTILWACLWGRGETAQDMGHVLFSLFNVAWASLYLEAWRRYSVELAFRWGTLSTPPELLEPPRPLYKGPLEESSVTGRLEPKEAPAWQRRAFRYFVSFPIIGFCLALVFVVMFLMLRLQDWTDDTLPESGIISCLSVIPKVLLAGAITLMDEAYYKLAVWLNDKENYRLQSKYENHLIAKVALFQFVNSFLSLFYIAFYLCDQEKLKEQLAGLLISRQIIGNLRESAFPYVMEQLKLAKLSFSMWGALSPTQETSKLSQLSTETVSSPQSINAIETTSTTKTTTTNNTNNNEKIEDEKKQLDRKDSKDSTDTPKRSIGQAEIESSLYKYDGTFADHLEMLVQMGYVVLFSAAFPLAGVCAICNNLLEIRSDAFKLAHVHQRPFGQRVANIGTWQNALGILGLAAVIVNCALIGLSGQVSRLWPGLTSTQTIILIVALEHIMLGLRSALTWLLPELPSWLAAEIARAEHCRREMQCKGTTPRPTPPSPPSTTSMQSHPDNNEQATDVDCNIESNHDTQSIESQLADDIIFHHIAPISPKFRKFDDLHTQLLLNNSSSIEADVSIRRRHGGNKDITPDSPILSHQIHMPARPFFQDSLTPSALHHPPLSGNSMQSIPVEIPPYSGSPSTSSTSSSFRITSQPIKIPEIPPFRKNQNQNQNLQKIHSSSQSSSSSTSATGTGAVASSTTTTNQSQSPIVDSQTKSRNIAEIPAYKPRKSNDWQPQSIESIDNQRQQQQQQHHHHHRQQKQLQLPLMTGTSPTKSTVGVSASSGGGGGGAGGGGRTSEGGVISSGGSGGGHGSGPEWVRRLKGDHPSSSVIHRSIDCIVNKDLATSSDTDLLQMKGAPSWSNVAAIRNDQTTLPIGSSSAPTTGTLDEEAKAAELAAKKSRVKQSLIKRARSVAIFSLKLKERRAKEAEKAALAAVEHAKAMAPPAPPGGELDLIGIEQLIQIDDVIQHKNTSSSGIGTL